MVHELHRMLCYQMTKAYICAPAVNTVDLVIFTCLNFREFLILGLFMKLRIREFSFFFSSAIIIIIFARFLNSRYCPPRKN